MRAQRVLAQRFETQSIGWPRGRVPGGLKQLEYQGKSDRGAPFSI